MITQQSVALDLVRFFTAIIHGGQSAALRLCSGVGEIYFDDELRFTLRGLHQALYPDGAAEFAQFRRAIYESRINEELGRQGCSIQVFKSDGKLEGAWYCLKTNS